MAKCFFRENQILNFFPMLRLQDGELCAMGLLRGVLGPCIIVDKDKHINELELLGALGLWSLRPAVCWPNRPNRDEFVIPFRPKNSPFRPTKKIISLNV